jgi:hypothetical protein
MNGNNGANGGYFVCPISSVPYRHEDLQRGRETGQRGQLPY